MLKTAKNIKFNSDVYPIGLPFSKGSYKHNFNNLILAGWGVLETTVFLPSFSDKLQETRVEHMPYDGNYPTFFPTFRHMIIKFYKTY